MLACTDPALCLKEYVIVSLPKYWYRKGQADVVVWEAPAHAETVISLPDWQVRMCKYFFKNRINLSSRKPIPVPSAWLHLSIQGLGLSWLFPFENGAPPIGWDDARAYLVLPVLLIISQYISQAIIQQKNEDPSQQAVQTVLKALPLMLGEASASLEMQVRLSECSQTKTGHAFRAWSVRRMYEMWVWLTSYSLVTWWGQLIWEVSAMKGVTGIGQGLESCGSILFLEWALPIPKIEVASEIWFCAAVTTKCGNNKMSLGTGINLQYFHSLFQKSFAWALTTDVCPLPLWPSGYFSLNVPSGLTLYWITNNILSTGQQAYLKGMAKSTVDSQAATATVVKPKPQVIDVKPTGERRSV